MDPTSTQSHYSRSVGYDHCILPFINVEVNKCIEHVSDKKEGTEDNIGSYGASIYGSTITTLNALITLWTLICVSDVLLQVFHICPKAKNINCKCKPT